MDRRVFILSVVLILFSITILEGCDVVQSFLPKRCPLSCDDNLVCTQDVCNADTNYQCKNHAILPCDGNAVCEDGEYLTSTDCPNCDDSNKCTVDRYIYESGECSYESVPNCCGNKICELSETASSCPGDCPSCDDGNACTNDLYLRSEASCQNTIISPCCGNRRCEPSESFDSCNVDCQPGKSDEINLCGANEDCITKTALKYNDREVCKSAYTVSGTDNCYADLAVAQNRSYYCSYISNEKRIRQCQEDYAVSILGPNRCPSVNPNNCLQRIALRTGNEQLCNSLTEQFVSTRVDFVLKCRAEVTQNPLICKQIGKTWIADQCYTSIAVRFKDYALCSAVILDKATCEFQVDDAIADLESI